MTEKYEKAVVVPLDAAGTFALVTQPDRLRRWMTVAARIELRAGGDYRWTVTPGHIASGSVVELDPGRRVVLTWGWENGGDPAPGESTVTITLTPVDGGTEVRLVHEGLTDEQAVHHAEGWNHYLDRLVAAGGHGDAGPDEWAAAPDPLDELSCAEAALAVLQRVLVGVDASDMAGQTPCTEFDVAALADHLMNSIAAIGAAAGADTPVRDTSAPLEVQVADAAQGALEAWRRRGTSGTVELRSTVPATTAVSILALEFLVHAWDFACATEQPVKVAEPVAAYVLDGAEKLITPEARGFAGFADPVEPGPDASALDRLIAFTGRRPAGVAVSPG
ncbi:ArsR family transcriptional regulator [Mycobacterium sp. Soil538]|nr:ArsR family transcriptional regulator [Mycobacterium sp. Soil538]